MGSGCTRQVTSNTVLPQKEGSSISAAVPGDDKNSRPSHGDSTKGVNTTLPEAPTLHTDNMVNSKLNCEQKESTNHVQRFLNDTDQKCSTMAVEQQLSSYKERKSLCYSQSRKDTLKHYDGQANLLELRAPMRQHAAKDTALYNTIILSEGHNTEGSIAATLPPTIKRRYKRQPTIENTVCFQEDDQINHYKIQEEIGRGSFAAVYRCRSQKNEVTYAMKVISKKRLIRKTGFMARHPKRARSNPLDALRREIAILKKVDHPNVVKLIEVIDDPEIDNVYMVFELIERGPAQEIPTENPMNEETARNYFKDAILGLEYLHFSRIVHRDIKPNNLLLDKNDHIKIADFGVSDIFEGDDDSMNRFAGSPAFQSPEAITGGQITFSGKAADIWAMGITLYSFVYGKCPFYDDDIFVLYDKIRNECVIFPDTPVVDPQLQDLISRLLAKDPNQRITMQEIKGHTWLTRGGRDPLPKTADHCVAFEISDEDMKHSVTLISKFSSLLLVKAVLKQKTFSISRWRDRGSRSNSTPDITQIEDTSLGNQTRISKSAASLFTRKNNQSSSQSTK